MEEGFLKDKDNVTISSKMNPLKTNKQRNISNSHRKNQQRSSNSRVGSTDEDEPHQNNNNNNNVMSSYCPLPLHGQEEEEEEGYRKSGGMEGDNENTTNNDEQIDSESENITDRICSLSKLSLKEGKIEPMTIAVAGPSSSNNSFLSSSFDQPSTSTVGPSSAAFSLQRTLSCSYPSFAESDSVNETTKSYHSSHSLNSSRIQHNSNTAAGATTGDAGSEAMDDVTGKRFRRRRRRRGHNSNSKRMAVETSAAENEPGDDGISKMYSIRPAEPSTSAAITSSSSKHNRFSSSKGENSSSKGKAITPVLVDSLGMKRKRTIFSSGGSEDADMKKLSLEDDMDEDILGDVAGISIHSPKMEDHDMKSYDDYSSFDESESEKDDNGREADDEQSDWVFDEWSAKTKCQEESPSCRKKRLMKMLKSYNNIISNASGVAGNLTTREIRAGKRRVYVSKSAFPSKGIWTSANEAVSKFLQNSSQSQIRLQPVSAEEGVKLTHLASLYSLHMDYSKDTQSYNEMEDISNTVVEDSKVFPVLTKTSNTTQMDKLNSEHSISSPFNPEGSSSSNVSSVGYGPSFSDVDSRSDSKRIKK